MAEPISLASGLLALATFAFQSSTALYNEISSFKSHLRRVRELLEELEALNGVLGSLNDTVSATSDIDLSALDLPLLRCGTACREFQQEITKCSARSGVSRTSFRDWAKLRYMGDNLDAFRGLIAGYKVTIVIALTDANLRKSSVNAETLRSYEDLITSAKSDLEAHLENINEKLESFFDQPTSESGTDASELRQIKEERLSTEKCLEICSRLSDHIGLLQIANDQSRGTSTSSGPTSFPESVTNEGLQECKESLARTVAKLEDHMQDIMGRMLAKSKSGITSAGDMADLARLRDEWETARQTKEIFSKADTHLKENLSKIENYATGDAVQFMVSTNDKVIHGSNRGLGWRSRQVGGHINDTSLQQLSRDFTTINIRHTEVDANTPRSNIPSADDDNLGNSAFSKRYGRGFMLSPKPSTSTRMASTAPEEHGVYKTS